MSTALYRRYRPETFADVIGQEHVTEPLMTAIDKDRINHAYLFSGPRGCGKTTSARILARCLNCAQGPTSTPCGTCDSCVELARNGSGSLDVIEIDAASHGGVDDARDLRERATFAPVRDRYKIFIIDEAHMVTSAGFNALLKIVEEPPEHILFIFATTEPDKVIGTIRSRTHHYPFRLVPPEPLLAYLDLLCRQETVPVAPGVLSLVIRAGGGSVRDSLSVLDQLMAGAGESGLDYELAVSLLGYTHATLLDDVVDSVAAGDAATVFNAVDRVIQTGHDPRRFVEDLLERFRDLIVINAVPEGAASILRGVPDDQLNRMRTQANQLGAGELSRAADVTNTALTEMTGATSPRLHLELLCARLLLPAADATARGTLARVDRIERRLEYAAGTPATGTDAGAAAGADTGADTEIIAETADDAPKAPARPRLDVPRTAEEAAARWSLPSADPVGPAAAAAVPGAHSPAVPAAARTQPPAGRPPATDSSPDWGGSWGVSSNTAFSEPDAASPPAQGPAGRPEVAAPALARGQQPPAAEPTANGRSDAQDDATDRSGASRPVPSGVARSGSASVPPAAPAVQEAAPAVKEAETAVKEAETAVKEAETEQDRRLAGARPQQPASGPAGTAPSDSAGPAQPRQEVRRPDPVQQGQPAASGGNVEMVRRAWPEILDEVARIKRATWLIVNVTAKPRSFEGNQLVLAFSNQGNAIGFQRGPHMDNLKQAIHKVLGLTCSIEAVHDAGGSGESGPKVPTSQAAPGSNPGAGPAAPSAVHGSRAPSDPGVRPSVGAALPGRLPSDHADNTGGGTDAPPTGAAAPAAAGQDHAAAAAMTAGSGQAEAAAGVPAVPPTAAGTGAPIPAAGTGAPIPAAGTDEWTTAAPARSGVPHTGSSAATRPTRTSPEAGATIGDPRRQNTGARGSRRTVGRGPAGDEPVPSEAVSAWDPSMSDDSWALVEPPEEAFDPGPGWGAVPEDPSEHRPPALPGAEAPRRTTGPAPGRTDDTTDRKSGAPRGASPAAPGPAAPSTGAPDRAAAQAPAPQASRSVVWSPPAASIPTNGGARPAASGTHTGDAGHRGAMPPAQGTDPEAPSSGDGTASAVPANQAGGTARPAAPPRSGPVVPAFIGAAVPSPAGERSAAPESAAPARTPGASAPDRPVSAENVRQKPVSRYQQLLDEAERKRTEDAAATRGLVGLRFVEDEPSADDETIEESGLVGRTAIERILNGRLIEERSVDGQ